MTRKVAISFEATMQPSAEYAYDKLTEAVYFLATGPGDVRSRLVDVYLMLHTARNAKLPPQMVAEIEAILSQLTVRRETINRRGEIELGRLDATLQRMKNATGAKIAKRVVALYHQVDGYLRKEVA